MQGKHDTKPTWSPGVARRHVGFRAEVSGGHSRHGEAFFSATYHIARKLLVHTCDLRCSLYRLRPSGLCTLPEHPFPTRHPILWQHHIRSQKKPKLAFCARERKKGITVLAKTRKLFYLKKSSLVNLTFHVFSWRDSNHVTFMLYLPRGGFFFHL